MMHPANPNFKLSGFFGTLVKAGAVFEPTTIALTAMALSTAVGAVGAISSAQAQSASYKSQAAAADANEAILRDNAKQASIEANQQEDQLRVRQRILRGAQVAGVAQSNIGFEGTGGDLIEQSDINSSLDDLSVRYEGQMKSRGLNTEANNSAFDAASARANASAATTAGYFGAASSVINGASSYASYKLKYGNNTNLNQ